MAAAGGAERGAGVGNPASTDVPLSIFSDLLGSIIYGCATAAVESRKRCHGVVQSVLSLRGRLARDFWPLAPDRLSTSVEL